MSSMSIIEPKPTFGHQAQSDFVLVAHHVGAQPVLLLHLNVSRLGIVFYPRQDSRRRNSHFPYLPWEGKVWSEGHLVGIEQTLQQTYFRRSARCVQSFDDSLDFAIRMTYRISLRSSSLWEPRHPLLKVLVMFFHWMLVRDIL